MCTITRNLEMEFLCKMTKNIFIFTHNDTNDDGTENFGNEQNIENVREEFG